MSSDSILLADTDHHTLSLLPTILHDRLPHMVIDTCRTVRQVCCRLETSAYTAVVMTPTFFHTPQILECYRAPHRTAPAILTVSQQDLLLGAQGLRREALDLIAKPMNHHAVESVRLGCGIARSKKCSHGKNTSHRPGSSDLERLHMMRRSKKT